MIVTRALDWLPSAPFWRVWMGSRETPIAGLAEIDGGTLRLRGEILRPDGSEVLSEDRSAPIAGAAQLGADMARELRGRAGEDFFDWITA